MRADHGIIRKARFNEIEQISALIRNTLLISNSLDYDMKIIQNLSRQYSPDHLLDMAIRRRMYVHITNSAIDGTISLKGDTIYAFCVVPDKQNSGIGSRLLEFIEEKAKAAGVRTLSVDASLTAKKFYSDHGYRSVRKEGNKTFGAVFNMQKNLL